MLLIISAKVAHSLWRYFSFSAEYTAVSPSANKPPRADAKTFDKNDVQLISQQNWFGKYQPVATPVKQPEPVPVAETRLNVVLRGIAFGARPGAVIEEGGKLDIVKNFLRIFRQCLTHGSRDLNWRTGSRLSNSLLCFVTDSFFVGHGNSGTLLFSQAQALYFSLIAQHHMVAIDFLNHRIVRAKRFTLQIDLLFTPVRKEGIVGYAVKPGADRSLFDASGFKEGDIAIALNQQDFTDPRAMIALMRQLPSMDSIQLTVLRKGARHDISIALR